MFVHLVGSADFFISILPKILLIKKKKISSVSITAPFITTLRPLLWIKLYFRSVLTVITERNKLSRTTGSSSTEDAALCSGAALLWCCLSVFSLW